MLRFINFEPIPPNITMALLCHCHNFISGLIVKVLAPPTPSLTDRVFESRRDETKDDEISICCMHIAEVLQTWRLATINRVFDLK